MNVTDSNGVWVRSSPVALVVAPALSGNISPSPSSPAPGQEVTFTADVSGGTGPISYSWAFGDGATDSGATVSYTFGSAGTYNVKLWVNDSVGGSTRITLNLTVGEPTGPFGSLSADLGIGLILVVVIAIAVVASIMMPRSRRNDDPVAKRPGGSQS
ncbi:MAG TPA: PKD domain-containing protein [Thermoplasmata archaeon]|nr:PKD domain-containing protein [Thermoplasmata archaeon]